MSAPAWAQTLTEFVDPNDWFQEDDAWKCEQEPDDPTWTVEYSFGSFTVTRSHGWYEQSCEAHDIPGLAVLFGAMDAAAAALNDILLRAVP